jgi:uncharacterized protein YqgC (DUF456 family)
MKDIHKWYSKLQTFTQYSGVIVLYCGILFHGVDFSFQYAFSFYVLLQLFTALLFVADIYITKFGLPPNSVQRTLSI